jgi:hypothetical protein
MYDSNMHGERIKIPDAMFVIFDILLLRWCRVYIMPFLD